MKKFFSILAVLSLATSMNAQLAWETEFGKSDYNNALTVISKSQNVSWSDPTLGIGGGLSIGKIVINVWGFGEDPYQDECVIALPQVGIAEKLTFSWQGASSGSVNVYQSPDHNNWSLVYNHEGNTISRDTEAEANLATDTRYLKFSATGLTAAAFRKIKVTELKRLSAGTDEWPFGNAMVDDQESAKTVNITWTNVVAEVSSTDPHFSASLTTIGQKNLIDQTTQLTIKYSHSEAGNHSGEIVIAGEGREARIKVTGQTSKYDQTLTWVQTLGECSATDHIELNAYTTSNLDVIYETSNDQVAYVEGNTVKIVCAGEVTLTATQPGNYKYNAAQSEAKTLTISKANPTIGVTVDEMTYGQSLSQALIRETVGAVEGTFTWEEIDPSSILDAGNYALNLLFTPNDECIYNTRTLPVAVHINKAPQTIVWEEQETELTVGQPVSTTAELSSGLPVTYAFTECLLSIEDGLIIPENEGEVTVVAFHPGNNNYLPTPVMTTVFNITAPEISITTDTEQLNAAQRQAAEKYQIGGQVYLRYNGRIYEMNGRLKE